MHNAGRSLKLLSIVIPIFNEEEVLPFTLARLTALAEKLPCACEWIFVDDGSRDKSAQLIEVRAKQDPRVKLVQFSRNFGHQMALTAGLDLASGEAVVLMDGDLQDPPELVVEMIAHYSQGSDIVYARRVSRKYDTWFKRVTSSGFYWLMKTFVHPDLPQNVGDFRLLSRDVVNAIREFRESHRFLRGLTVSLGFSQSEVTFERPPREQGVTKFPISKMMRFAWDAIVSFSALPIKASLLCGCLMFIGGAGFVSIGLFRKLVYGDAVPGWASLVAIQTLIGSITLLCLGMIGSYVGRIYEETKHRPLYVVRRTVNLKWRQMPDRTAFPQVKSDEPVVSIAERRS